MSSSGPNSPRADLKIVILGGGGVGKSSFIYRYMHNDFTDTLSTIAGAYVFKKWKNYHFSIWDMAGQDKFAKVSSFYCKGAGAAILAYDITDSNSFDQLVSHVETIKSSQDNVILVIIGTKYDLVEENPEMRQVSIQTARRMADSLNAAFFETSARSNINVEEVFNFIGHAIFPLSISVSQRPLEDSPILGTLNRPTDVQNCNMQCCFIQ